MAAGDLVLLSDAKTRLQIGFSTDDTLLAQIITNVSAAIQNYCPDYAFTAMSLTDILEGWVDALALTKRPVVSVTAVTDRLSAIVVDPSLYDIAADQGLIYPLPTLPTDFPMIDAMLFNFLNEKPMWARGQRRWQVDYEAGFASVPADVQEATLIQVATRYNRRDALAEEQIGDYRYRAETGPTSGFSAEVEQLLSRYRGVII